MYNLLGQRGSEGLVIEELPKFTFWKEAGGSRCHVRNETGGTDRTWNQNRRRGNGGSDITTREKLGQTCP